MHGSYRRQFGPENLAELIKNMGIQHEDYLKQDDADKKADALRYMAGYATQYLHLVPQEKKFIFKETDRVLHNSAMNIAEFDPREGCLAFKNLAKYAENLLEQPWRKDFHVIKLTSGYYVHNVAAQLQNAHEILIVMGYVNIDDTTLKLLPNPNYANLKAVSRDCYIASQECMILSQIWQHVADQEPDYPLTIGEVFEYRKNHLGDTDTICNKLLYDIRQRMHLLKQQQQQQLKFQQQQQLLSQSQGQPPLLKSQQRFVPVDRLIDYGVDDHDINNIMGVGVDEPDLLPSRGFAPEREVDRAQEMLKTLNINKYVDDEHIYDPVYGSVGPAEPLQQAQNRRNYQQQQQPSQVVNNQQYYPTRKSVPNYNAYQPPGYHNNFVGSNGLSQMYGDREQSMSPMIPKTVTSLFQNNTNGNGINSRNNVSKSNSMNSINRAAGASSSGSSSTSQNLGQALTKMKIKETDLDEIGGASRDDNPVHYNRGVGVGVINQNPGVRAPRKSLPVTAFANNYQQNNQVYADQLYPPTIVKPVAVYGTQSQTQQQVPQSGPNYQYYGRARQNSDNSEDVLNEAYAYASEVNQMPKNLGSRVNLNPAQAKVQAYQHQATPIPPQNSDSDSHSELKNQPRGVVMGAGAGGALRSGSSTDASSSWEGSVLEGDFKAPRPQQQQQQTKLNRKSEPVKRPNHIEIHGGRQDSSLKMRYADSSPESDLHQPQHHQPQQPNPNRNKNGYRELSSSSSGGGSPGSSSSLSRNYPRNEELSSLDTVYYDYLLKQGQTDEILGRDSGGSNGNLNNPADNNERDPRLDRKKVSKSSSHAHGHGNHPHQNFATSSEPDESHLYDGRRVIPKKKQNTAAEGTYGTQRQKKPYPVESVLPGPSSRTDPNYNNLISAEITKPSHEKNVKKSTNSERRDRSPVESEDPQPPQVKKPVDPWDCRFCTFRNTLEERICEVCAKSKDFFEEDIVVAPPPAPPTVAPVQELAPKLYSVPPPQAQLGSSVATEETQDEVECPQCTLLNPVRARVCDACNFRLKPVESPRTVEEPYDIR